ncbi:MAG: tetratricopeptide repeat protein [Methanosarcina mazei]
MPEKPDRLREEAVKHFNRTIDLMQEGKPEESLEALQKAENAAQEAKSEAILFHTLKARGQILQSLGRLEEALDTYVFSLKISYKSLLEDPANELYTDTIRLNLNNIGNLGNIFQRAGNFILSKQCYETGLEICQKLLDSHPENTFYQMYTGNTLNNLGELLFSKGQLEEAEEKYEKALEIYEKLLQKYPEDTEYLSDKEMTLNNLGILFSQKGQKEAAKKNFKESLEILEILSKKDPRDQKLKEEIALRRKKLEKV